MSVTVKRKVPKPQPRPIEKLLVESDVCPDDDEFKFYVAPAFNNKVKLVFPRYVTRNGHQVKALRACSLNLASLDALIDNLKELRDQIKENS